MVMKENTGKLPKLVHKLAKTGQIGPKQLKKFRVKKLRGSKIPTTATRGGVAKGMAGN